MAEFFQYGNVVTLFPKGQPEMEVEVRSAEEKDQKNLEDIMMYTLVQWPPP